MLSIGGLRQFTGLFRQVARDGRARTIAWLGEFANGAVHANPETTYRHYDRWKIESADATA
jgi:hypothetical protein